MPGRGEQHAARFAALNAEVIDIITSASEAELRQPAGDDGRLVVVLAHHIASVNSGFARMVESLASGNTYNPSTSMDEIHEMNAEHARDYAAVERDEVLDLLRSSGAAVATQLRAATDERLDGHAGVFGGNPLTVEQVVEYVVIGHTAEHLGSIRATLGAEAGADATPVS